MRLYANLDTWNLASCIIRTEGEVNVFWDFIFKDGSKVSLSSIEGSPEWDGPKGTYYCTEQTIEFCYSLMNIAIAPVRESTENLCVEATVELQDVYLSTGRSQAWQCTSCKIVSRANEEGEHVDVSEKIV